MQFKHPEILYALLLLIIPIIVHLFQLRRFRKTEFTNVKFLKNLQLQTRRSSQIKKWLTLLTRMLLLAAIIVAFAQPYFSSKTDINTKSENVVYLDNSFSMQAIGDNGSLLNDAVADIIEYVNEDDPITLFTNNKTFSNTTLKAIKNDLIKLEYTPTQLSQESITIKGKEAFSEDPNSIKNLIVVSDFQRTGNEVFPDADSSLVTRLVELRPTKKANVSIDTVFISDRKAKTIELTVELSNYGDAIQDLPVSLYNGDKLVAKSSVSIEDDEQTIFTIPNDQVFDGRLFIEEPNLIYDNTLYFNLDNSAKIKVLSINNADDDFLRKIYTQDEFVYSSFTPNTINFRSITEQNLLIINELDDISIAYNTAIQSFANDGGNVIIIPSEDGNISSYNQIFSQFGASRLDSLIPSEKRITSINFSHPLLLNVFDKKVTNFQYPRVQSYYASSSNLGSTILSFEDGSTFLTQSGSLFGFTASVAEDNSNFKNSPLIVPIFYNIGKQSLRLSDLYYKIGEQQQIDVDIQLSQDEILTLGQGENSVIPLQQTYSNKVRITTDEFPDKAGIISVINNGDALKNISFNYDRSESDLNYYDLSEAKGYSVNNSVATTLSDIKSETNVDELWEWFVIFALIFLLLEILILKYLK